MQSELKRLFFAQELHAPWPDTYPKGRLVEEENRHVTLAFLGLVDFIKLKELLKSFPKPTFKVGFVGKFDQCLFLPKRHPRVVAWHLNFLERTEALLKYQNTLTEWLNENGFLVNHKHAFNPHVTLSRAPFAIEAWKESFSMLPFFLSDIHLFESLGHSKYASLWSYPLLLPFDSIEHTADLAYLIRGENFDQLYWHGFIAIAFFFPEILNFSASFQNSLQSIEEVIEKLNESVFLADKEMGCPLKAVSFHTDFEKKETHMEWEMIVDV